MYRLNVAALTERIARTLIHSVPENVHYLIFYKLKKSGPIFINYGT